MKGFVGVTDNDWFGFLSQQQGIDEVNFWQFIGTGEFMALEPGETFLPKLYSPLNCIVDMIADLLHRSAWYKPCCLFGLLFIIEAMLNTGFGQQPVNG